MRRSRSALTAWPAFADLMTVLAVLGLAIAAGVAIRSDAANDRVDDLQAGLDVARQENARDRDRIQALEAELAAAREDNRTLEARLEAARERDPGDRGLAEALGEARARIADLETRIRLGSVPCLGTRPGSLTAPVPLPQIVVDAGYRLTRRWPPENAADVADIPALEEAIAQGVLQEDDFSRYARAIRAYGNRDDTYRGPCRFWVELRSGETTPLSAFAPAFAVVTSYFLLTNPVEANRILREAE